MNPSEESKEGGGYSLEKAIPVETHVPGGFAGTRELQGYEPLIWWITKAIIF